VLAAHRAGIKRIIMPERNRKDLLEVPDQARKEIEFVFATQMDDVLKAALDRDRSPPRSPAARRRLHRRDPRLTRTAACFRHDDAGHPQTGKPASVVFAGRRG